VIHVVFAGHRLDCLCTAVNVFDYDVILGQNATDHIPGCLKSLFASLSSVGVVLSHVPQDQISGKSYRQHLVSGALTIGRICTICIDI